MGSQPSPGGRRQGCSEHHQFLFGFEYPDREFNPSALRALCEVSRPRERGRVARNPMRASERVQVARSRPSRATEWPCSGRVRPGAAHQCAQQGRRPTNCFPWCCAPVCAGCYATDCWVPWCCAPVCRLLHNRVLTHPTPRTKPTDRCAQVATPANAPRTSDGRPPGEARRAQRAHQDKRARCQGSRVRVCAARASRIRL